VAGVITLAFATTGDICYEGIVSANTTFAISGGSTSSLQRMKLAVTENSVGGFVITLPASPTVLWPGGVQPAVVTAPNARNVFKFGTTGTSGVYDGGY
jgi:hypothetical protein